LRVAASPAVVVGEKLLKIFGGIVSFSTTMFGVSLVVVVITNVLVAFVVSVAAVVCVAAKNFIPKSSCKELVFSLRFWKSFICL
jgi:hypothetical protein